MLLFSIIFACLDGKEAFQQIEPIYGVPNIDDDNENGQADWDDDLSEDEDDLSELEIPASFFSSLRQSEHLRLRQMTDNFRVYLDDELLMN